MLFSQSIIEKFYIMLLSLSVQQPSRKWGSSTWFAINWSSGIFMSSDENMVSSLNFWYNKRAAAVITISLCQGFLKDRSKNVTIVGNFKTRPWKFRTGNHTYREMKGVYSSDRSNKYPVPLIVSIASIDHHRIVDYGVVWW